mmetsp:Transcript_7997/g.16016  ORF Transcript_7997/g.16016 Transcript_7997/m.16016 type:complete len:105 (-) Transcript_7997:242-556(-)
MTKDDIGYVSDADETFNRDFLRAMQVCLVPEFEYHNHCELPLVRAHSATFEGSFKCLTSKWKRTPSLVSLSLKVYCQFAEHGVLLVFAFSKFQKKRIFHNAKNY